jgi:hypothetical protein
LKKARPSLRGQAPRGAVAENAGTRCPASDDAASPNDMLSSCCLIIVACRSSRSELMQCTPSHDSCRFKPYHLHTYMSSCKTLAAYRSIDTYKFVRSTPRIPADDEHKSASRQCHVTSKHFVVSSRSMTSDQQRQLHNLTETVDASPRASKSQNLYGQPRTRNLPAIGSRSYPASYLYAVQ